MASDTGACTTARRAGTINEKARVIMMLVATTVLSSPCMAGVAAAEYAVSLDDARGSRADIPHPHGDGVARLAQAAIESLETEQTFSIAPQSLASALRAFGIQSDIQVAVDGGLAASLQTRGVTGTFPAGVALEQLLQGTGLRIRVVSANSVTLEPLVTQPESGPPQLGPITVEGQLEADPADVPFMTPGSSAYISLEQIERIRPSAPGDIFNEVPGVFAGAKQDGNSINVNIRSAQGLNRVRTMVEGTQQETSFTRGYAGADQRTYIDPDLIGGVEISKGPGVGPYATGTTSGVVNVRLLDADDLVPEGETFGFRLRGGLGGNSISPRDFSVGPTRNPIGELADDGNKTLSDSNWFGSLAGAVRTEHVDLVAAYARRKEGNYFAGNSGSPDIVAAPVELGGEVPNTSEDSRSFLVKGALRLDGGHSFEAGYNRFESEFGQAFPSELTRFPLQQYGLSEVETNRYWLRYKWDSEHDLINLQVNVWGTDSEEDDQYFTRFGDSFGDFVEKDEAWGTEAWNTGFFDTPLGGLTVTAGAEYTRAESPRDPVSLQSKTFTPVQPPFTGVPQPRVTRSEDEPFYHREVYGAYVNAAFEPTDWLTLHGGLRYDGFKSDSARVERFVRNIEFDNDARDAVSAAEQAARDAGDEAERIRLRDIRRNSSSFWDGTEQDIMRESETSGDRFSPNVGVTVEPTDGLQFFARYSEGLRAASLAELGRSSTGFPNPNLKPEVLKSWEVGGNYMRDGLLFEDDFFRGKLVYFDNDYDNFVARQVFLDAPEGLVFINLPDVSTAGFEMSLSYDMGRAFADFNFTHFTELLDAPTQISAEQPEISGTLTLGTRWLDEKLELGGRLTFFNELQLPDERDPANFWPKRNNYWHGQQIVDLFGSYQVNDHLTFGFSVENVTDVYYVPPLFVSRIPAPGRTFRVHLTAKF